MTKKKRKTANMEYRHFLCSEKPIISLKEARKILGKNHSEKLSDADLSRMIGIMHKLADGLLNEKTVPKNNMVI